MNTARQSCDPVVAQAFFACRIADILVGGLHKGQAAVECPQVGKPAIQQTKMNKNVCATIVA